MASPETDSMGENDGEDGFEDEGIKDAQQLNSNTSTRSKTQEIENATVEDKQLGSDPQSSPQEEKEKGGMNDENDANGTTQNEAPPPAVVKSALSTAQVRLPPIKVK